DETLFFQRLGEAHLKITAPRRSRKSRRMSQAKIYRLRQKPVIGSGPDRKRLESKVVIEQPHNTSFDGLRPQRVAPLKFH
ncbi:MAG TPA: hypothetical protein VFJ18_14255, partial [Pararhizobium sp.]|nr:hypothetical protein [Pararhizobium sp.]